MVTLRFCSRYTILMVSFCFITLIGIQCGEGLNVDYPYLIWPILDAKKYDVAVCAKDCPTTTKRYACRTTAKFAAGGDYADGWDAGNCAHDFVLYESHMCKLQIC